MNILVTGANGQLGREMRLIAPDTPFHFIFTDVTEAEGVETTLLDITSPEAVKQLVKANDIRSLARDIGRALDSGAYLTALRRTKAGR